MRLVKTIDECNNCLSKKATVLALRNDLFGNFKLKLLCRDCFKIKKAEGTLYA